MNELHSIISTALTEHVPLGCYSDRIESLTTAITTSARKSLEATVRTAIHWALADHAPAGKRYGPDGGIVKICRCGLETDGGTLAPRTQHLEDVITAAVLDALGGAQ